MREVSSAASYNAVWKPPRRHEYEDSPPSYPSHYSSLPPTPQKSTSPSRSHIASPQAQPLVTTQTQPRDRISYSPTRNTFAPSGASLTFPQSAMANSGDRWGPPQDHNYYNVPPPPPPQGYHMNDMDDRYQDTSYGGHNGGYNDHYGGYDAGDSSVRDNHFNRNSFYEHGAYPDMTPSPARLSRPEFDAIDPHSIADEDDARDFAPTRDSPGKKRLSKIPVIGAAAVGSGAGAGAYSAVGQGGSSQMLNAPGSEKAAWRDMEEMDRKRRKRNIWIIIAVVAVLAIAGGVVGGILGTRKNGSSSSGSSAGSSSRSDGLNLDSKEIKALMNNKDLHKVFPVMDYTAYKTQYPDCVLDPPSQDNVTMDLAVLSQLTPAVRVYGTDCNQTEMIMTAIDRLNMNDTMKVWLGVWIDGNQTTNDRQMKHMYDLLDKYPQEHFLGVIVGNEALFRKEITETALTTLLSDVRKNLTSKGINLSVSTSDLGSAWTQGLAAASDHVMGNIHPFFAGVPAPDAAGWTYVFWQGNNVAIAPEPANAKAGAIPRNIISEVGWPSGGGNDCGTTAQCADTTSGSVAGVPEMNQFMDQWVCGANDNGTMYFWFEAYDEPWKVMFNTAQEQWEDKWGLMGIDRKLKPGIKIPDCGGKTVFLPSK